MDNLTHTITGVLLSRAGLNRLTPRATAILAIASNIPDLDIPLVFFSEERYLAVHRGSTHGLAMAPLLAVLPVALVALIGRRRLPWPRAWLVSLIGVLLHLAFDLTNIYGIRLLAPFSYRWFALDITSVIDAWIWLALAVAMLWQLLERLVSAEIGARPKPGRGLAVVVLLSIALYDAGRWLLHERAVAIVGAHLYRDAQPVRVAALPRYFNPFRWTGLVETRDFYMLHDLDLRGEFDPTAGRVFYKAAAQPAIDAALRTSAFRVFLGWARYPLFWVTPLPEPEGGVRVQVTDLRFAVPAEGRFVAAATVGEDGTVREARFRFDPPGGVPRVR
jgi:inner membrane protein